MKKNSPGISASLINKLKALADNEVEEAEKEKCDFCGKPLPSHHRHLVEISTMKFICTCEVCVLTQAANPAYKPIPQRYIYLEDFNLPDELWAEFLIPVNVAFFVFNSAKKHIVAFYPAPMGATESKLKLEPWEKLEELNPILKDLMPDLEVLMINKLESKNQYFIVPIDSCYELIGTIRTKWKGIFGGREVDDAIRNFFTTLKERSQYARFEV